MRELNYWDYRFLSLAKHVASWSKDMNKQVGAVITIDNQIISLGFNGFARGVHDDPERLNDREIKLLLTIHAEINAIHFANQSLKGATLYTWPCMPCSGCAANIIQKQIKECVAPYHETTNWKISFDWTINQFSEAKIDLLIADNAKIK